MNALERCEEQKVKVRAPRGVIEVDGYRWQDFAVVRTNVHWLIAHLPSGLMIGSADPNTVWTFPTPETAAEAMVEVARLRNRWVEIPEGELEKTTVLVDQICGKWGGVVRGGKDRPEELKRDPINGYEEPYIERKETS